MIIYITIFFSLLLFYISNLSQKTINGHYTQSSDDKKRKKVAYIYIYNWNDIIFIYEFTLFTVKKFRKKQNSV